jgi:hypothetical protein
MKNLKMKILSTNPKNSKPTIKNGIESETITVHILEQMTVHEIFIHGLFFEENRRGLHPYCKIYK